jgi:hypothetical protein
MYSATRWTPAGCPPGWAAVARPTICGWDTSPQEWLATSDESEARTSGGYWHHQRRTKPAPAVDDEAFQGELLDALARFTATPLTQREPKEN